METNEIIVRIHGNTRRISVETDGLTIEEFSAKYKDVFGIPDNTSVLVNGAEASAVKPGDTVTFQSRASSKA
jgi:hypothetical protein